jgi:hypothetical protein
MKIEVKNADDATKTVAPVRFMKIEVKNADGTTKTVEVPVYKSTDIPDQLGPVYDFKIRVEGF